jgi:hypothetical protein
VLGHQAGKWFLETYSGAANISGRISKRTAEVLVRGSMRNNFFCGGGELKE